MKKKGSKKKGKDMDDLGHNGIVGKRKKNNKDCGY